MPPFVYKHLTTRSASVSGTLGQTWAARVTRTAASSEGRRASESPHLLRRCCSGRARCPRGGGRQPSSFALDEARPPVGQRRDVQPRGTREDVVRPRSETGRVTTRFHSAADHSAGRYEGERRATHHFRRHISTVHARLQLAWLVLSYPSHASKAVPRVTTNCVARAGVICWRKRRVAPSGALTKLVKHEVGFSVDCRATLPAGRF